MKISVFLTPQSPLSKLSIFTKETSQTLRYYFRSTKHTIPKNNMFPNGRSVSRCLWRVYSYPCFCGLGRWGVGICDTLGAKGPLLPPWMPHRLLTPHCSTELSQHIKHSLSQWLDFKQGDTAFRLDHPTKAFLENNPWAVAKACHVR